jgi:putative methyltransferase (TIGR01177 family)
MYLYLTTRSEHEKQLIAAECEAITGAIPDERGIALSGKKADVSRAAYVKSCMKIIIHASDLTDLYIQLEERGLQSQQFRVSLVKLPRRLSFDSKQIMHQVGARVQGKPDLSDPKTVFLVVATQQEIWLGEVLSKSDDLWNQHTQKAHLYSSALPARLARAMVNLVAAPGDKIIDPCCGSGTILIEAVSMGIKSVGCDINHKLAIASAENLRHFGLNSLVMIGDARNLGGKFNAVVTDLPYGRNCPSDEKTCYEILQNLKNLAPKAALVAGEDISSMLLEIGYTVEKVIPVPKTSLTRYIHVVFRHSKF